MDNRQIKHFEALMSRWNWIMEYLDDDNRTVSMLVELFDGGQLECVLEEGGPEPVLLLTAKTDKFDIVEIDDPLEQRVAGLFRSGMASYMVREPECCVYWRLNSTSESPSDRNRLATRGHLP